MEQVEVITSVERRRRYSDQQKLSILAEAQRTSVARVAKKFEISPSLIYLWKKNLKRGKLAIESSPAPFVKVATETVGSKCVEQQPIYVHLDSTTIIEFPASVDMAGLVDFIRLMRG